VSDRHDPLLAALREVVGASHVLADPGATAAFTTDWTGRWSGAARAVVRPGSRTEVAAVMTACVAHAAAIVPQGGNTGLVGGGVPRGGEVVVVCTRLDHLGEVDVAAREVTVGAGVTLAAVQAHAAAAGLAYGVDLAARGSATIGGTVATDAGGIRVVRYGTTRDQVLAVEVARSDGRIEVVDDPSGLDAVVGSEGTHGIVTSVRVRLHLPSTHRAVALLALDDVSTALAAQARLQNTAGPLEASELLMHAGMARVVAATGARPPFDPLPPAALLVEVAGETAVEERFTTALAEVATDLGGVRDVRLGIDAADRARLWQVREAHTEVLAAAGPVVKLDVVVPLERLAEVVGQLPGVVTRALAATMAGADTGADTEVVVFGHLGVGDLHVNLLGVPEPAIAAVEDAVFGAVVAAGGQPFGEHGVGRHKRHWVERTLGATALDALQAARDRADPSGLLNPGVRLP
jgi:FAD/FMN-containing dehydrogenase